jgi:DNA-binding FadR family transcriptional regulator
MAEPHAARPLKGTSLKGTSLQGNRMTLADANQTQIASLSAGPSLASALVRSLSAEIAAGRFKPGERLPTEQELMRQAGVSRTVVREAVAALRAEGLVSTRQGVGAFVRSSAGHRAFRIDPAEAQSIPEVMHVMDLRIGVETEAAAIAAGARDGVMLADIEAAHAAFCGAIERGELAGEQDFAFHRSILVATGNPYFPRFLDFLGQSIIPRQRVPAGLAEAEARMTYLARVREEHLGILLAIRAGNASSAQAAMRAHLTAGRDRYRRMAEAQPV